MMAFCLTHTEILILIFFLFSLTCCERVGTGTILPVVRVFLFGCFCVLTKVHNGQMHFPSVPVVYMVRLV